MRAHLVLLLMAVVGLAGCGRRAAIEEKVEPLTVAEWKTMPVDQKYEVATFERLQEGEPELQSPDNWAKFQRTVIVPSRRKDFSGRR